MSKLYFYEQDSEMCLTRGAIEDKMVDDEITEKEVFLAKMEVGTGVFYCKEYGKIGEVGQGCGKECKLYIPRNKKNGRCVHSSNVYNPTKKVLIKI